MAVAKYPEVDDGIHEWLSHLTLPEEVSSLKGG